ncbi:MAG: hypothetical protein LBE91_20340 [Tannerella sp.]|jgi:uncharacterized Fe-S cluster-containing radical SAM superfamily protein|nr:hypothetical protein [Tannerella sp.]
MPRTRRDSIKLANERQQAAYDTIETLDYLHDKGYAYYFPTVCKAFSAEQGHRRRYAATR